MSIIAALYANSNFEGKDGADARQKMIDEMEERTEEAIYKIYQAKSPQEIDDVIDPDDPFFAAMRVPGETSSNGDQPTAD